MFGLRWVKISMSRPIWLRITRQPAWRSFCKPRCRFSSESHTTPAGITRCSRRPGIGLLSRRSRSSSTSVTLAKPAAESGNAIPMPLLAILAADVRKKSLKMRLSRACSSSGSARPERKACSSRTSPWLVHRRSEISQKLQLSGMRGEATLRAIIIR